MVDNQVVFAIVFATIYRWLNDSWHLIVIAIQIIQVHLLVNR
jgi:hypothetical protein